MAWGRGREEINSPFLWSDRTGGEGDDRRRN